MSETRFERIQKLLAVCGIVGPPFYAIVLFVLGLLQPGYNHVTQLMSELGEVGATNALIMNTLGFPLLGLMLIAFAFGLHRGVSRGRWSFLGPALGAVSGIGLILSGLFPCDPGCVDVTSTGRIHSKAALMVALSMTIAPLAIFPKLERGYQAFSVFTAILTAVISMFNQYTFLEQWEGATQRLGMGMSMLWIEVMGVMLLRRSSIRDR